MGAYFRLHKAIEKPLQINIAKESANVKGNVHYGYIKLEPGKEYDFHGDEIMMYSIKSHSIKKPSTPALLKFLQDNNIPYTAKKCPVCGNRSGTTLEYKVVEVFEDGNA